MPMGGRKLVKGIFLQSAAGCHNEVLVLSRSHWLQHGFWLNHHDAEIVTARFGKWAARKLQVMWALPLKYHGQKALVQVIFQERQLTVMLNNEAGPWGLQRSHFRYHVGSGWFALGAYHLSVVSLRSRWPLTISQSYGWIRALIWAGHFSHC